MHHSSKLLIRQLGKIAYSDSFEAMKQFTQQRSADTLDEIWLVEHPPVFTQGQSGKSEHILATSNIPIIQTDRGGQVTYHGPGQIVLYVLINIEAKNLGVRDFVRTLENALIQFLETVGVQGWRKIGAPGIYVDLRHPDIAKNQKSHIIEEHGDELAKIASIGLKIRKGSSYHGISFNFNMDLTPFSLINPCGYKNLKICQLSDFVTDLSYDEAQKKLSYTIAKHLGYTGISYIAHPYIEPIT